MMMMMNHTTVCKDHTQCVQSESLRVADSLRRDYQLHAFKVLATNAVVTGEIKLF